MSKVFSDNNAKYGYPRIQIVLENKSIKASCTKVYRYMKIMNLYSDVREKSYKSKPKEIKRINRKFKNIVNRKWNKFKRNELWVTDVSYIPCNKNFVYLSVIKDVATGFIVGHKVSKVNDNKIYKDTWDIALKYHDKSKSKIIHSDNGFQYTSIWAQRFAKANNITISLSKPGSSLDNAACETFFSQLKTECKEVLVQKSFEKINELINNYINYYNFERIRVKDKRPPANSYFPERKNHSKNEMAYFL